jgi:hypothetical protein
MPPRRRSGPQYLDGATIISSVLKEAEPRPTRSDPVGAKNKYASRFADAMAARIANDLSPDLPGITATPARTAASARGRKQLDVNFSTPQLGLGLGISLKSVHLRDVKPPHRYTHNLKRNEEELRIEASGYHKRQPYAVMVAAVFLPFDSCEDGRRNNPSSFGSWVRHLRPYTGRREPDQEIDRFEKIFIALYEPDGSAVEFFDVELNPPKNGRPRNTISYGQFLSTVYDAYLKRNEAQFQWADGAEEPLDVEGEDAEDDEQPEDADDS